MAKGQARDPATGRFLPKVAKVKGPKVKHTKARFPAAPRIFLEMQAEQKEMMKKMDALEKKMHEAVDEGSSTNDVNAEQKMKKMEKHVKEISDQCVANLIKLQSLDDKFEGKVYAVGYDMRTKMGLLQDRFEAIVQENTELKERLGNLEYTFFKNAIEVAEDLKAKDKVIAQLQEDLEKLKEKK